MLDQNYKDLQTIAQEFQLSDSQIELMRTFVTLLEIWNNRLNLISKNDVGKIGGKHIYESLLYYYGFSEKNVQSVLDLGSGAGFPGIPLKIAYPNLSIVLVESRRQKALFLREALDKLKLQGLEIVCERAENLPPGNYDVVTARAVSTLSNLWKWSSHLLKVGGRLVTIKGDSCGDEITQLEAWAGNSKIKTVSDDRLPSDKKLIIITKVSVQEK